MIRINVSGLVNSSPSVCEQQRKWEQAATVSSCLAPSRFLRVATVGKQKNSSPELCRVMFGVRAADADERPVNTPSWDLASEQTACVVGNHSLKSEFNLCSRSLKGKRTQMNGDDMFTSQVQMCVHKHHLVFLLFYIHMVRLEETSSFVYFKPSIQFLLFIRWDTSFSPVTSSSSSRWTLSQFRDVIPPACRGSILGFPPN